MRIAHFLAVALVATAVPSLARAQNAAPKVDTSRVDLTGTWSFAVIVGERTGTPTITFKQKGDSINGTYVSNAMGRRDFTGTIRAGKVNFGFNAESGGVAFSMTFSGTMDNADSMSGSVDLGGNGTASFTGKRNKP